MVRIQIYKTEAVCMLTPLLALRALTVKNQKIQFRNLQFNYGGISGRKRHILNP